MAPNSLQPFVGSSAFAHKGGMHVNAIAKDSAAYEHIAPELVGNRQRVLISELGGKSNVLLKAQRFGIDLSLQEEEVRETVERVKELESRGVVLDGGAATF
jgi:2-isopropylmalate synthase